MSILHSRNLVRNSIPIALHLKIDFVLIKQGIILALISWILAPGIYFLIINNIIVPCQTNITHCSIICDDYYLNPM